MAVSKDGSITKILTSKVREKAHHILEVVDKKSWEGKFNPYKLKGLEYEERLDYLNNKDNLPNEVVFAAQDKYEEIVSAPDINLVDVATIGRFRDRGTLFINKRLMKYMFRDEDTYEF